MASALGELCKLRERGMTWSSVNLGMLWTVCMEVQCLCSVSVQDLDILKLVSDRIEKGGGW